MLTAPVWADEAVREWQKPASTTAGSSSSAPSREAAASPGDAAPASSQNQTAEEQAAAGKSKPEGSAEEAKTTAETEKPPQAQEPADRPKPEGFDEALKQFSQKKWAAAQKMFEKFIKDGVADVPTHFYLAYCLYNQQQYSRAQKEFEWVSKYGTKTVSLRRSADAAVHNIQSRRAGVCPATCIKPHWYVKADGTRAVRYTVEGVKGEWSDAH